MRSSPHTRPRRPHRRARPHCTPRCRWRTYLCSRQRWPIAWLADGTGSYRDILRNKDEAVALEQEKREVKTEEVADRRTRVQKSADWIAEFAGSIPFLMLHVVWFGTWLLVNSVKLPGIPQFDPFPFGFLTLSVSLEAIFLSVFVLLSQNRQAAKDRVRSDIEYDVNLKAELEIVHLHEKVDRLTSDVLGRLERLQRSEDRQGRTG